MLLVMQKLNSFFTNFDKMHIVDKSYDRLKRAVNVGLIRADLTDAKLRLLPQVVLGALRNRDIEFIAYAAFDLPEDAALLFQ